MKERWQDRVFTGSVRLGPLTVFGANAMHWALNLRTPCGMLCLHPTTHTFGGRWPWYAYLSPNGTPWAATWAVGPGVGADDKCRAHARRRGECFCADEPVGEICSNCRAGITIPICRACEENSPGPHGGPGCKGNATPNPEPWN